MADADGEGGHRFLIYFFKVNFIDAQTVSDLLSAPYVSVALDTLRRFKETI